MSVQELMHFKDMLMAGRKEILERVRNLEAAWRVLSERESEIEEEAQKAGIKGAYDRLGEDGKDKIEMIDLALSKITIGEYGICEGCGDDIAVKRLEALPWTRLCVDCAREHERRHKRLPATADVMGTSDLPEEYQGLTSDQLTRIIHDRLRKSAQVDSRKIKIYIRSGTIYLEGAVNGEDDHQVVLEFLTEEMGFGFLVDLLEVDELRRGRRRRSGSSVDNAYSSRHTIH